LTAESIETREMYGDTTLAKACECTRWRKNINKIDALILLGDSQGLNVDDIAFFKFCPWCGKRLEENYKVIGAYG